jgi:hypothetical protein
MNGLAARRARCCGFHLPANGVADEHVSDYFAALQLDIANLER